MGDFFQNIWSNATTKPTAYYHVLSLYYSAVVLFTLPVVGCLKVNCEPHDGVVSVSSIMHVEPLSTSFAFYGALFLFTLFELQTMREANTWPWARKVLALFGSYCFTVPLILPLDSVSTNTPHLAIAAVGATLETLLGAHTLVCAATSRQRNAVLWAGIALTLQLAAIALGGAGFAIGQGSNAAGPWLVVVAEYFCGAGILLSAETAHFYIL